MSRDILFRELEQDVGLIDNDFLPRWEMFKIEPIEIDCIRTKEYGIEKVYIVARSENEVILYDDVEEEFGIGAIDKDNILRYWDIFGGLDSCIKCFPGGKYYGVAKT